MHKNLILIILLLFLVILIINKNNKKEIPKIELNKLDNGILFEKNSKIDQISTDLIVKQGLFSLNGHLNYKKDNNFHMELFSFLSKEIEIGSNDIYFWFWSKNLSKSLFYCDHKNISQTRLKSIFYPKVLKTFLCIDKTYKFEKIKENIIKISIFDEEKIKEQFIFIDEKIELIIKIIKHQQIENYMLPKIIEIQMPLDNIKCIWILENTKINQNDQNNWQMPNYKEKINLLNY